MKQISQLTVQRLILYRKLLNLLKDDGEKNIYSHKLATLAGSTPAQVRRDLMVIGYSGSAAHGYKVEELAKSITDYLDKPEGQSVALVGLGNLGRAILDYCYGRRPNLKITASFDKDSLKIGRVIHNTRCYHIDELEKIIRQEKIDVAIITIPIEDAHTVAERLVKSGVTGILNYSPTRLNLPDNIYVENRDMMMALEKTAFFARDSQL